MVLSRGKRRKKRLIQVRTENTRAAIHRRAKNRLGAIELERGAGIGTLRAKQECNARSVFSRGVSGAQFRDGTWRRLPPGKGSERFPQLLFAFANRGHAACEVRSAGVGAEADVHEVVFGMLRKILFEAAREVLDRILRPGGKRQDVIRAARQ